MEFYVKSNIVLWNNFIWFKIENFPMENMA